jgi:hypothetical protein
MSTTNNKVEQNTYANKLNMKLAMLFLMILAAKFAVAQPTQVPKNIRSAFEGTWQQKEKNFTNTVSIQFEPGKDHALFTDKGTGVAPSKTFKLRLKKNLLILPAVRNQNDYLEMEIIKGVLHLRSVPVQWDQNGHIRRSETEKQEQRIFKRVHN